MEKEWSILFESESKKYGSKSLICTYTEKNDMNTSIRENTPINTNKFIIIITEKSFRMNWILAELEGAPNMTWYIFASDYHIFLQGYIQNNYEEKIYWNISIP